jgi:hypothetical protein
LKGDSGQRRKDAAARKKRALSKGLEPDSDDVEMLQTNKQSANLGKASKNDKGWMEKYERLIAYQHKTGFGSLPPKRYPKNDTS